MDCALHGDAGHPDGLHQPVDRAHLPAGHLPRDQLNPLTPGNTGYMLWMLMGFMVVLAVLVVTLGPSGTSSAG